MREEKIVMERLFKRHDEEIAAVPMSMIRSMMQVIDWSSRLLIIKGAKGVGKSTLMQQYIKMNFKAGDRSVLYCSADSSYFSTHTLLDTADTFVMLGGKHLFIDEVHKYHGWSREIKEMYDTHKNLHIVLSGSSLLQLNDGDADLSRRMISYMMPGLSFREFLRFDQGVEIEPVPLKELLGSADEFCSDVKCKCLPVKLFKQYLQGGFYPFYFENRKTYPVQVENVVNYIIDYELPAFRNMDVGNTRKLKALLRILAQLVPYEIDVSKLSRATSMERATIMRYLKNMEEAKLICRLFQNLDTISDLQKPDKILLDNPNLLYVLSDKVPEIGTVRETFFCNQLISAGHKVEYGGLRTGDFKIDGDVVIEVGGAEKGYEQIRNEKNAYIAADDIDSAVFRKIPLWAFGFLY